MFPLHLPHGGHGPMHHGLFAFFPGFMLLLLAGLLIFLLIKRGRLGPVRWAPGHPPVGPDGGRLRHFGRGAEDEALHTLRMRLANGDITPEEFLERSSVLRPGTPPTSTEH